jgi:DNA polymerase III subunit epsilon
MRLSFIDFETATGGRASACALGLVVLDGLRVVERRSWLIRPPGNIYSGFNIAIHGITPEMTRDAPGFDAVWAQARPSLDGGVAVAHNASFDVGVLRGCLDHYGLRPPDMRYYCTLVLGRALLPEEPSHRLNRLCERFGIAFRHHDATEDAWAASQLLVKYLELAGAHDIAELAAAQGVAEGRVCAEGCSPCRRAKRGKRAG